MNIKIVKPDSGVPKSKVKAERTWAVPILVTGLFTVDNKTIICSSGRIDLMEIPVLLHMLHYWKTAFLKYDRHHSGKTSSFNLRLILWDAGLSVSNKVLECLVLR